ncbi:MAG: nucleoside-diphosphate sugar epimerase/dehydratase [Bacteroidia bacterium]
MKKLKSFFTERYAPRWIILFIDLSICITSIFLAYILRYNFSFNFELFSKLFYILPVYGFIRLLFFGVFKTYSGIIRYASLMDAKRIFVTITSGTILLIIVNLGFQIVAGTYFLPMGVIIIDYIATLLFLTSYRLGIKILYNDVLNYRSNKSKVLIYGAGRSGLITKRTIDHDSSSESKVVAFIDDDTNMKEKTLEGVGIFPAEKLGYLARKYKAKELIISIEDLEVARKQEIVEQALALHLKIKTVPPARKWINGELSLRQIQSIRIESLLERDPIQLDWAHIEEEIRDKVVLVTGASGSIGSELVRQLTQFYPSRIVMLDQAETPLFEIENELKSRKAPVNFVCVVGDVRNYTKMEKVFRMYRPHIVYHAAAYKHVPLMESFPSEAILTNVGGTKILADLSLEYDVEKFVMISTDKAVNPTNVMGASKRLAEIYIQSLDKKVERENGKIHCRYTTTRFGNVLGSNGSVIPLFRKQIAMGGPVTVTHPDISRYFMTIPESCQLILEAGTISRGGEIFIFDMGDSVKIVDLAHKMIRLSGLTPGKDIQVEFSGLRPGEKIREELLANKESTLPTHHPKIMIASVREYDFTQVNREILNLLELVESHDDNLIVTRMKELVPEYISQNSIFQALDHLHHAD